MSDGTINRFGDLVVPIPTADSAQEAVNAALDSADDADMREILNTQGDLHEKGSSEANAAVNIAAAKTADELAVEAAEEALVIEIDKKLDAYAAAVMSSPVVIDMVDAALEDADEENPVVANVHARLVAVEEKVKGFEAILDEFKQRALLAFKHAGFRF
jgi:hypothetical protein